MVPASLDECATSSVPGTAAISRVDTDLPDYQEMVSPTETAPHAIALDQARVVVTPGAVATAVSIGITRLDAGRLAKLDPGMTNVTGTVHSGYRFTPHPMHFTKPVQVTLPYDPSLLPQDFTTQDIFTYFYDDVALCWRVLERIAVDETAHTVTSVTDHFTDMVNSAVTAPEHPENVSFNPNQLKGIQNADPGSKVNLIAPPKPGNRGDNQLAYPVEIPAGRLGVHPTLNVAYSSGAGDGWLGMGWNVPTPMIAVDTRWGVPRYDAAKETETYLLNGEQLTPVAHRGPAVARTAEKVFHTRIESEFATIVRHGSDPRSYTWEVVDKAGTRSFYGGDGAMLKDQAGNGFLWGLREMRDRHDNLIRYHYALVEDPGVDGGAEPGRNLYPQKITYTGSGSTEGRYSVSFVRDRDLNEPPRVDKMIDARGGFKRVTADLLRRIDIKLDNALIRRYELTYTTGAFKKTLLRSIAQLDENGAPFNEHDFTYFDDIRDTDGNYQAFGSAQWTVPGDGLSKDVLNRTDDNAGKASALQASTSISGGGHLYLGFGDEPSKDGSAGVKMGFNRTSNDGVLALLDVDGDSLPDKVFRSEGTVKYRKNLSGPHGQARFSDEAKPLALPGIMSERSDSVTLGLEAYPGAAIQLDFVNTFATTDRYFSDVNGDGVTDLVSGSSVLFGRLGAGGVPVYGISADTPVPITPGNLDTSNLFGDFTADRERQIDSFPLLDTVRRWVAPFSGTVSITGPAKLADETAAARATSSTADGVIVAIQHEGEVLWSERIPANDNARTPQLSRQVNRGDRLYFRVQSVFDGTLDDVSWNPVVTYQNVPADATDVDNLTVYRYEAARDFTLGGRSMSLKAPLTGTLHLAGDFHKNLATTDDVTVVVTRDGTPVFEQSLASTATGVIPLNLDVAVQKGQTLKWRVRVDSPIDAGAVSWVPHALYTTAPDIDIFPSYDLDLYPVNDLQSPQGLQHLDAEQSGRYSVTPQLSFDFGQQTPAPTARVAFTVKQRGALLGKAFFDIVNGVVAEPAPIELTINGPTDLAFDFSTLDPKLATFLTGQSALLEFLDPVTPGSPNGGSVSVPTAFHSAAEEGAFAQPYRGWAAIGYNGNRDKATQPIAQGELVLDESYADSIPDEVDPQGQQGTDFANNPTVTPPRIVPLRPSPVNGRWEISDNSWVAPSHSSSSRMGTPSISLPDPSQLAGSVAVPRVARSRQISLTGSVGGGVGSLGGSIGAGNSTGLLDFLDMNGDGFPDVVGTDGIQYTDPTGGLGATNASTPDGAVRESGNIAGNASAGSAAGTISTGRGNAAPEGRRSAETASAGNDMPPLGIGGDIGGSSSDEHFDLIDVNGDGLPDRVRDDGKVSLNLGYRFGALEQWRNPSALNDGSGSNFGLNLGFNTDFYGFAGGASYQQSRTSTASTLVDMNGDGLADRVFAGNPIRVGFNTGNGFETPVEYKGSLDGITLDRSATLGGGVYFTIPICFFFGCIIINPGANIATGAGRSELALRDVNGDRFVDHVLSTRDDQLVVAENKTGRTNLLQTVSRPLRGKMAFDYDRDGNTFDLPESRFVLSRVSVDDKQPGDGQDVTLSTFEYSGGVYNRLEREFLGYSKVVTRQRDTGASEALLRSITEEFRNDSYYTAGLPVRSSTTDAAGGKFTESENTIAVRDVENPTAAADLASTTATLFPQVTRTDHRFFERQATAGITTFTTMEYDGNGNVIRAFDAGDPGSADDLETVTGYTACGATHIVGMANSITVRNGTTVLRRRESNVDCDTGDVTQVRSFLANGNTSVDDMLYFADGNLRRHTGPSNKDGQQYQLDYTYDTTVGVYVESVVDSFGLHSATTHNVKFGVELTSTDTNNQTVTNVYDPVGRIVRVTGPYEAPENRASITFEYHPEATVPYAVTKHVDRQADNSVAADTIDTIVFADGLGRPIQSKKDSAIFTAENTNAANVMVVSGRVVYDALGRAVRQHFPLTEPKGAANTTFNPAFDPVQPTVNTFDTLDRVTRMVLPDNTITTAAYGFGPDRAGATRFETVSTDANGKPTRTYRDLKERTTAVKQFNPAGGQPVIWTSFGYNALGEQTSVVDDRGNVTTIEYDNLGQRTAVTSPDSGREETVYDLAGNMIKSIPAKLAAQSKAVEYDYDFNRLKAIRYPIFAGNNVSYTYGAPGAANNAAGRVTNVTDGAGTVARKYGPLGEVVEETRVVQGQGSHVFTFVTGYIFDTWNRMLRLTFPDGEVLSYHYDSGGEIDAASGVKGGTAYTYVTRLQRDKFGEKVLQDTGNGTRTRYTYNPVSRRLDNLKARIAQGYEFQNLNYTYDNVGNVTALNNATTVPAPNVSKVGGPSSETYQYDDLYRLTHAQGSYQPSGPKSDQYTLDTQYDSISNVTGKSQVHTIGPVTDGKLTYTNTYGYTSPKPHAAITIGVQTFAYDADGSPISRNQQSGPRRQMIWDEEDRLACSHENVQSQTLPQTPASCDNAGGTPNNARYLYDDQGQRIVKDDAQFHVYPNQNYSIRGNHEFKHIFIGSAKLLTKTVEAPQKVEDQQFYNHADHLGSTGFVTDADGGLAEHLMYVPGGETWVEEKPVQPVPHQYTGKEFDPQTGYYYYGARYYDPRTAQWQGTDPALPDSAHESVGLSTYAYAGGNPMRFNDPDGRNPRTPIAAGGGGGTPRTPIASGGGGSAMDPNVIRFVQDSVDPVFQDGRTIQQLVDELKANPAKASTVEPIKVFQDRGVWYTLDNRRVVAFQKANVNVPYELASGEDIAAAKEAGKFSTTNDGVSIKIRHEGRPAEQWETHYVKNPGTPKSTISRLSPANRGLSCSSGACGSIPEPPAPGRFFRFVNGVGKFLFYLQIFQAIKADYDHYSKPPDPNEPKRRVIQVWPFPGFVYGEPEMDPA